METQRTTQKEDLTIGRDVKTPCGHLNAVCFNVWPFDLWECLECHSHFNTAQIILRSG